MASFKVPCPSCEAAVLIKNPSLVGTKVECPKCKYRFKVEEPAPDAKAATESKDSATPKKEEPKKAASGGSGKKKKLVPFVVGGLAVVILGIVGYSVLGGSGKKKTDPFAVNRGGNNNNNNNNNGGDPDPNDKDKDKKDDLKKPTTAFSNKVTTNLLPGQSVAVYRFNMEAVRQAPVHGQLVDQQVAAMLHKSLGFQPDEVDTYIHCFAGDTRDPFAVVKLATPTKPGEILSKIQTQPKPKTVKGRELHAFRSAPFLTAVSHALSMRSLFGDMYTTIPMAATAAPSKPYGVCVYDTQHILVGDYALLERFLGELGDNGYPPFKSELNSDPVVPQTLPDGTPGTPGMPPGTPNVPGAPGTGAVPLTPPGGTPPKDPKLPPPVTPPATGDKPYTNVDAYRTIEIPLKRALDELELDKTAQPLLVYAEKFDARHYDPKQMKKDYTILSSTLDPIATRLRYLSANILTLSGKQLVANIRLRFADANDARTIGKDFVAPGLTSLADVLKLYLTTPVEFRDYTIPGTTPPGTTPGTGIPPGFGTPPGTGIPPGLGTPPGLGVPPGGGSGSGIGLPPAPPMGGGSSGGPISPIGPGGPGGPGSIGLPGVGPGSGGNPTPKEPTASASHIDLALVDNQLLIAIDVSWSEETNRTTVEPRLVGLTNQIKGKMAIFSAESSQHATASVGPKAIEVKGMFPRGTADRVVNDRNRQGLPYPPMQRVSLFAELLPHLGHERLAGNVNKNLAWYDEKNLPAAGAWVPELLAPSYPQAAWRATSPFAPDHVFGATNYVAISGAGLDSARYDPTNPEHAKKVGITGYNWGSKASEVTDGLANTIYLLQTPPAMQQPWIAGGGATIRGFDESDPMAAFKHNHGGKQGTYALMGDGSVRFIPANINPKVLVAMGTRAGGESLADVDTAAPVVPPPKPPEVKKPEEKKEPEPKPKEPAAKLEIAPEPREKK